MTRLEQAVRHALKNPIQSVGRNSISRFGAILTDGTHTFYGWNSYRTHPLQARFGSNEQSIHIHAELDVLIKAIRWHSKLGGVHYSADLDLGRYSLYVARVLKNNEPAIAKPCSGCQQAIAYFNIQHTEWTK